MSDPTATAETCKRCGKTRKEHRGNKCFWRDVCPGLEEFEPATAPQATAAPQEAVFARYLSSEALWLAHNSEKARANALEAEIATLRATLAEMTTDRNLWQDDHEGDCPYSEEVKELRATLAQRDKDVAQAQAANERDRTALHRVVRQIDEEITGRMWLIDGRGAYEWDDDRYRQEFGWAVHALQDKLEPLRKIAGDLSNCPTTQDAVDAARAAQPAQEPK